MRIATAPLVIPYAPYALYSGSPCRMRSPTRRPSAVKEGTLA
jgi:hypothetical protein